MTGVTELGAPVAESADGGEAPASSVELNPIGTIAVTLLIGAALVAAARASALALLIAVAAVQALLAVAWVYGTRMPGRKGALIIAAAAAAGSDVAVSVWPNGKLGALLGVVALAVPAMFVHQLMRGAARVRVVASLGATTMLVMSVAALPALIQLRHEFAGDGLGGRVTGGVIAVVTGALLIGIVIDMLMPAPRFDAHVNRGLLGVIASAGLGGSLGHLLLRSEAAFFGGRGAFVGAALGALVALFAVGVAFGEASNPLPRAGFALRVRPVLTALLPLSLSAPVAYLLCLAIRA